MAAAKRKPTTSADRAEGYAGKGKWIPGPGSVIRSTKGDPNFGSLSSQQVARRTSGKYSTTKNTPMGRPSPSYKPRNPLPSKPDRAEGYGKPGGKWVPSGRTGLVTPNSNWSDLDSQITKRNIPKWQPDKPMGRPTKGGSGVNAKPKPATKKKAAPKPRRKPVVAQSPRQMMRPIIPRSL